MVRSDTFPVGCFAAKHPTHPPGVWPMKTVAFVNRKGGVGKSSCVMHLGIDLARQGHRVLLVDADPQASLSQGLLGRDALTIDPSLTLAQLFDAPGSSMVGLPLDLGRAGLGLVAGHEALARYNVPEPWLAGDDQVILRDGLGEVADGWDLCLIDCPPSVQLAAWCALAAADGVVVPAQLEDFGIQGVAAILDSIDHARSAVNPALRLLGILPTMVARLAIHADYDADARAAFGDDVFAAVVPASVDMKTSVTARKGVSEHRPRSAASKAIRTVGVEMLARLDGRSEGVGSHQASDERIGAQ